MDENTLPEPSLEDSIRLLLGQVPVPVRNFVLNDLGAKTADLMTRYQLHVDQGGILERELLLMLLGQKAPSEFIVALQNAGFAPETIQPLTNDINNEVFMKLRDAEEKNPESFKLPGIPAQPVVQAPSAVPAPTYVPPAQTPRAPIPAYVPPPTPVTPPQAPPVFSAPVAQPQELPEARTMASDIAMVKSGGFPEHPSTAPMPARVPSPPIQPLAPTPIYRSTPVAPPMPQQSQAIPPQPAPAAISVPTPAPIPKAPAPQSENREALHEILKSYGVDPYREPAE